MSAPTISAVLCVHDEEGRLAACLDTLGFADEIVVLLDRCTDRSKEIAETRGAVTEEGAWEIEGERRNRVIALAASDWIFEIDADERVTAELAKEIRRAVASGTGDIFDIPVLNHVGGHLVRHGWAGNFGKNAYPGLFRKGVKSWGRGRVHPGLHVTGRQGPDLVNPLTHHIDDNISAMLRRLDRYTSLRAMDLVELDEIGSLPNMARKLVSRFLKSYLTRKGYKEGGYGILIALCTGLYPLLSHVKASLEIAPRPDHG